MDNRLILVFDRIGNGILARSIASFIIGDHMIPRFTVAYRCFTFGYVNRRIDGETIAICNFGTILRRLTGRGSGM